MRNLPIFLALCLIVLFSCDPAPRQPESKNVDGKDNQAILACAPEVTDTSWYRSGKSAPLFSGLDGMNFPISTTDSLARRYFNQGLMLSYGFNHAEAARSFYEAARRDSSCAMCWWGFAYVLGPNYNGGMEKDNFTRAYDAVQRAKKLSANASPLEKDLIDALDHRYTNDTMVSRATLDSAYAAAMGGVNRKYPQQVDVGVLYAESLMDLHPWNLWKKDGNIQPWTGEILDVLQNCLGQDGRHAGANHFYVHATEMSAHAEVATKNADLLMELVPGSGHLLHMPSHTYIRTGRYHDGVLSNQKAALVDSLYMEACHAQGVYPLAYYPHNNHFMAACATLCGESRLALEGANATAAHAQKKLLRDPAWATLQHYYSIPWYVAVKLGKWKEIESGNAPDEDLKYPSVVWNYAQGMASLARNNIPAARSRLQAMKKIMTDTSIRDLSIWGINNVFDLCRIAEKVLEGEICAREKNYGRAVTLLQEAVVQEDALNYNEPPDWFFSVRHHLGAVLLDAGKYEEAVRVYEQDLKNFRENGWALKGLSIAYEKSGNSKKAAAVKERFEAAWKNADIPIASSRIL